MLFIYLKVERKEVKTNSYPKEKLELAIKAVLDGMKPTIACKEFQVPWTTLHDNVRKRRKAIEKQDEKVKGENEHKSCPCGKPRTKVIFIRKVVPQ
jgi:hypothetical protein